MGIEITTSGCLPAGTDVEAVLRDGDTIALHAAWDTYNHRQFLARMLPGYDANPDKADLAAHIRAELAKLAEVTDLQALSANRRLTDLLTGRRWLVMQEARENGVSWAAIGDALGITKQGAIDWYKRKIADQEKYVPDFHDTARARAVLDGAE
ncbi:hypothetical protein ACFYTF_30990 [Nocardia thailandica]|uniref:Uncharacterized protein n=1 Tax=Nocardia thailandica TaxID=257275 RepID=A0ABW6PXU3_9NOCA